MDIQDWKKAAPQNASDVKDILLKASEDIQQGMWCQGQNFRIPIEEESNWTAYVRYAYEVYPVEALQTFKRCAEGSIWLSSKLLGHALSAEAISVARVEATETCDQCDSNTPLFVHNDSHCEGMDAFEAGQHFSEIFRRAADRL